MAILAIVTAFLIACQPGAEIQSIPKLQPEVLVGQYRLKASPDLIEEVGLDQLPLLVLKPDHFRLVTDEEESSGLWKYEAGKLSLSDKETGDTIVFMVDETGTELTQAGDDPIVFIKVGVETKPE